jgi:polysaccharide biosynthesis/export protein
MIAIARRHKLARGWALAGLIILNVNIASSADAQVAAPQPYRIARGDKIGVTVFGQAELSGDSTVDQNGYLRLPIIGDVPAADLTLTELEQNIGRALEQGYVRRPAVSARIAEYRPIYVLGMVRTPGFYPYREGELVLAAIARAGGFGSPEQGAGTGDLYQADERVRVLEISRAALVAKRARLIAQRDGEDRVNFPDLSTSGIDPARLVQIREGEQRAFASERQAEQEETEALRKQLPRLEAEMAALKEQERLELRQRDLNQQLIADYEQLNKSGLARKPTYIEVKREEARIEGNVARLKSEALKAELSIGELNFKIAELHNTYQRRVSTELRETDRSLLELTITLPAAQRARAARAHQLDGLGTEGQPPIAVIRNKGAATARYEAGVDFLLQSGDIVQVGSLIPPSLELSPITPGAREERKAQGTPPQRTGDIAPRLEMATAPAPAPK